MDSKPSQVPLSRRHITALDGVRGFAALSVFVFHYGGGSRSNVLPVRIFGTIVHFGWAGVSLFFVLSGFLISGILWDSFSKPKWWGRFYTRRSLRIFPLYYLALLITVVFGLSQGSPLRTFFPLWIIALYLDNMPVFNFPMAAMAHLHLEHFWSLAVEEQFYIFWPFLLAAFTASRKNAKILILGLWTLSLVFRLYILFLHFSTDWQSLFLLGRAGELLAGAYLAMVIRGDQSEQKQLFRWAPIACFSSLPLLIAIILFEGSPELGTPLMSTMGLSLCSVFFASIVAMALRPGLVQSFFESSVLRYMGKISYGIYVYHLLFHNGYVWLAERLGPSLGPNALQVLIFAVALISTLIIATISFYTYEQLFLIWKDRLAR